MIPRDVLQNVTFNLKQWRKVILVLGPRQSGKTVLLGELQTQLEKKGGRAAYFNCDLAEDLAAIDTTSITTLTKNLRGADYLLVDEAQRMANPGLTLKIVYDNFPKVQAVATGSSSFELKNKLSDAMTGRYVDFILYPLSFAEAAEYENAKDANRLVDDMMLYGQYPEVYLQTRPELKKTLLSKIAESYLFKDILEFSRIRNSQAIQQLARALAYQIGAEINENELAGRVKIDRKTLLSYLDILEKAFVVQRLYPYSQNPRREIGRRYKIYFVDLGIRNMLIGDFNPLSVRSDAGAMWENFLVMERIKQNSNRGKQAQSYFWRSYNGAEVDYIEIGEGKMTGWEIKGGEKAKLSRGAGAFTKNYGTKVSLVNRVNFRDKFLL